MNKGRDVKERKRFYWIYRAIEFSGVVLVFIGILSLIGVVGGSDIDDIFKVAHPLSYYIVRVLLSVSIIVLGLLVHKTGEYGALVQRRWLNQNSISS